MKRFLKHAGVLLKIRLISELFLSAVISISCSNNSDTGEDPEVTTRGSFEITGRLMEIRGKLPLNDLYDYVFVFKYEVLKEHRGTAGSDIIYVGHYNPLKPRAEAPDERVKDIGGNIDRFRPGDVHRMALEVPVDDYYMGGIINRYFEEYSGPVYWAVWTNRGA